MRSIGLGLLMVLYSVVATAQLDPNTYLNPSLNPALIVSDHRLQAEVNHWNYGNRSSTLANASFELNRPRLALGITYSLSEFSGYLHEFARLNLAYRFKIGEHSVVPGVYFGFKSFSFDLSRVPGYGHISSGNAGRTFVPDMGVGLHYRYRSILFAISAGDLNSGETEYGEINSFGRRDKAIVNTFLYSLISYDAAIGRYFRIKPVTIFRWTPRTTGNYFNLGDHLVLGVDNISKVLTRVNTGIGFNTLWSDDSSSTNSNDVLIISSQLCFKWFSVGYSAIMPLESGQTGSPSHLFSFRVHLFPFNDKDVIEMPAAGNVVE
jgi:hypothetical protein